MATVFNDVKRRKRGSLTPPRDVVAEDAARDVKIRLHKSPGSRWSDEDPAPTIDRVCDLGRKELAAWIYAWFGDLEIMHENLSNDLNDEDRDNLRQRTDALKRCMLILDFKADVAEELVSSLGRTEEPLATVEREAADLKSQLQSAKAEIAELRAKKLNFNGLKSEDIKEVEPSGSKNGGKTAEPWSAVVGRRDRGGPGSEVRPVRFSADSVGLGFWGDSRAQSGAHTAVTGCLHKILGGGCIQHRYVEKDERQSLSKRL